MQALSSYRTYEYVTAYAASFGDCFVELCVVMSLAVVIRSNPFGEEVSGDNYLGTLACFLPLVMGTYFRENISRNTSKR